MTTAHPGTPTHPLRIGAPLDPDLAGLPVPAVAAADVQDELRRAEYELLYALARHRKAWQAMRVYAKHQDEQAQRSGDPKAFLDSDPIWKVKTGDVTWWRGEVAAQAAAVTALKAMLPQPEPVERLTVRQHVYHWDPLSRPTREQVNAARTWLDIAGSTMMPNDRARCERILRADQE